MQQPRDVTIEARILLEAFAQPHLHRQARDVFELMRKHSCWEFPPTGQQANGDLLLFYLGSKVRHIVGEATVAGPAAAIEKGSAVTFDRERFPFFAWRMPVRDFKLYPSAPADLDLLM